MARITVWDGAECVGGSKILLQDDGLTLWLDFGLNMSRHMQYYEEYMKPQTGRGLYELLVMGLLPPVEGIYHPSRFIDEYRFTQWQAKLGEVHGVLLSHAHLDHAGCLQYLHADVPLYCSTETAFLLKALQECGQGDNGTIIVRNHEQKQGTIETTSWQPKNKKGQYRTIARYRQTHVTHTLPQDANERWCILPNGYHLQCEVKPLRPFNGTINGYEVRFYPVDHSIPGAGAWAVQTSAGWVVYTGDLRFRGKNGQLTQQFLQEAGKLEPVALIMEGTRIGKSRSGYTEDDVGDGMMSLLNAHRDKLFVANFSMTHLQRLEMFWECAKQAGRRFVVNPKDLYLLEAWNHAGHVLPLNDPTLALYAGTGAEPSPLWQKSLHQQYADSLVTAREIGRNPHEYLLCFGYFDLNELPYMDVRDGVWVQSFSEPFNEEQRIDDARLNRWLVRFGFRRYPPQGSDEETAPLHVSGHASGEELQKVVEAIKPKTLIPVHTDSPQKFSAFYGMCQRVVLPATGKEIVL